MNASYDSNRNELPKKEISSLFQGGKTKSGINAIKNYIGAVDEQYSQTFSGSDSDTIVKNISSVWNPETWKLQVFVGPPLSGAPFHHHAPAFNFLFLGIKHWTILPPGNYAHRVIRSNRVKYC